MQCRPVFGLHERRDRFEGRDRDRFRPRTRSRTPPRRRDRSPLPRGEALWSPHGKDKHDIGVPATFKPDSTFYDSSLVFGRALPRRIVSTPWSQEVGLAGRDLASVALHEVAFRGWENFHLRALANGQWTSVLFAKSVRETQLVEGIMKGIRSRHLNPEVAAFNLWKDLHGALPVSRDDKNAAMNAMGESIVEDIEKHHVVEVNSAQQAKILELYEQLAEAQRALAQPGKTAVESRLPVHEPSKGNQSSVSPLMIESPPSRPLRENSPSTVTTNGATAWLKKVPPKLASDVKEGVTKAQAFFREMSPEHLASLPDVAAGWGLSVRMAADAQGKDLVRIIVAASVLAK